MANFVQMASGELWTCRGRSLRGCLKDSTAASQIGNQDRHGPMVRANRESLYWTVRITWRQESLRLHGAARGQGLGMAK